MNQKFRYLYLLLGFAGLIYLVYHVISNFNEGVNPINVLLITIPDMLFFFLAYKTYPIETEPKRRHV
jgi:hypothetical protein